MANPGVLNTKHHLSKAVLEDYQNIVRRVTQKCVTSVRLLVNINR